MTTWRKLIARQMAKHGESFDDVVHVAMRKRYEDDDQAPSLDAEFDSGFGSEEGSYFTVWTQRRVYFPACYDGSEWCASVPRDPCDEATENVGG